MTERYCPGPRCADCGPDEADPTDPNECCEATCGCCPRVDAHDLCFLRAGAEDDTYDCDEHRMYGILRYR